MKVNAIAGVAAKHPAEGPETSCKVHGDEFGRHLGQSLGLSEERGGASEAETASPSGPDQNSSATEQGRLDTLPRDLFLAFPSPPADDFAREGANPTSLSPVNLTLPPGTMDEERGARPASPVQTVTSGMFQRGAQNAVANAPLEMANLHLAEQSNASRETLSETDSATPLAELGVPMSVELKTFRRSPARETLSVQDWISQTPPDAVAVRNDIAASAAMTKMPVLDGGKSLSKQHQDMYRQSVSLEGNKEHTAGTTEKSPDYQKEQSIGLRPAAMQITEKGNPDTTLPIPNQIAGAIRDSMKKDAGEAQFNATGLETTSTTGEAAFRPQIRVLDIVLQPAELGRVAVKLKLTGPALSVALSVESRVTKELLDRELSNLQDELSSSGYEIEAIHIQETAQLANAENGRQDDVSKEARPAGGDTNLSGRGAGGSSLGQSRDQQKGYSARGSNDEAERAHKPESRLGLYV